MLAADDQRLARHLIGLIGLIGVVILLLPASAHGQAGGSGGEPAPPPGSDRAAASLTMPPLGSYARLLGGMALGRGVRLNNPFRLSTQLGDTAESLSLTATYADAFVGAAFGDPSGLEHGVAVHGAMAIDGIAQEVVTPGYLALLPVARRWVLTGRLGLPIVIEPDANVGYELAVGALVWLSASWGLGAEAIGTVFQGAGTPETGSTVIPIVSLQLGGVYQFEVLP